MLKRIIKNIIIRVLTRERLIHWLGNKEPNDFPKLIFQEYGYFESVEKQRPIDLKGNPLPWYTYPSIEFLSQLDLSNKTVLEWGCGNSTLYFAGRVKFIDSIEDNEEWYNEIKNKIPNNAHLHLVGNDNYLSSVSQLNKKFDIIIIDAQRRNECAQIACDFLNEKGMIIIDNSDWFKNTSKTIRDKDFIQVDFHGFGPINDYTWTTSVFFSRNISIKSYSDIQPNFAIGGLNHISD